MTEIHAVHTPEQAVLDVVFIHGLDGDARKTWSRKDAESFWPEWLAGEIEDVAVWTVGYDAWSSGWVGQSMPMQDRAINLMALLQNHGIGERPLCFVTHSMGGLLAKEILLHAADGRTDFAPFAAATKGVVFLATPHTGAGLTKALEALGVLYRGTPAVKDLERNKPYLRHLNDRYRNWVDEVKIRNLVFFETHPTRGMRVVDETSANPGLARVTPIAVDTTHVDICKPADRESLVYGQVKRFITTMRTSLDQAEPVVGGSIDRYADNRREPANLLDGTVHLKAGGQASDEIVAAHRSPPEWSALPELPPDIRSLIQAQAQAARELPYRLPGARRPSLATVYVRQDLGSGAEEPQSEQQMPTPLLDDHGRIVDLPNVPNVRVAVRPPARTVREALYGDRHLVVTGGPGQGKSTLSLRLAADIAARWDGAAGADVPLGDVVVPLRLTARTLATRLDLPFAQALAETARTEYGALLREPLNTSVLNDRVAGCPWLLLVDGLDEVADRSERDRLVTVLAAWASSSPDTPYRVVLTTRPIEGAALAPLQRIGAAQYELQPFDDEALRRFAENWFAEIGADNGERFLREIHDAHLDELVKVPLLATIAAIIFEQQNDRPLPDNQYELYEAYLSFLESARASAPGPFGRQRTPLLEHLGRVRLESDTSLMAAARDWALRNIPANDLAKGWQDQLSTFLSSTCPLVIRSHDLSFLHHSFAEHLAASAIARTLPERFDPDDDGFANYLHTARLKEIGRHARAVLLHYARLRSAEADPILRWLHSGASDQHLLAARLLARHIPASTEAVDAFLVTVHGWAMTTQHTSGEILHEVCRAAHHPGLIRWLLDLMRSTNAPWRSRIEAASALAIWLHGTHSAEAISLLGTVVDDAGVPIDRRLDAAEALAESGVAEGAIAERGLRSVLRDPLASGESCRTAAVVLSAFGARPRADAVAALFRLVADPDTPTDDLVEAATGLVEIGIEFHERCAEVFRAVLHDPVDSMVGRRAAARGLASLGHRHLAEAVAGLTALIDNRRFRPHDRGFAANVLGELGPQHRISAGEQLVSILAEPQTRPHDLTNCASQLAQLGPDFKDHAVAQLRSVITDPGAHMRDVLWAARYLADIGPEFRTEATEALWKVHADPLTSEYMLTQTLDRLVRVGGEPHRQRALDRLRAIMLDCAADPMDRCRAAEHLIGTDPEFHAEAAVQLRGLADNQLDPHVATKAWRELLNLGTTFQEQAFEALLGQMSTEGADGDIPSDAIFPLAWSNADHIELASKILFAVQVDQTRSLRSRVSASRGLLILGRKFHRRAAAGLRDLLCSATAVDMDFVLAVRAFADAGTGLRTQIGETLRDVVLDPHSPSTRRWMAVKALNVLGIELDPDVITALHTVIGDESTDSDVRMKAAVALTRTAPTQLAQATDAVLKLHGEPWLYWWRIAVLDLVQLGADVEPRLRAMLEDNNAHVTTRSTAATLLVVLRSDSTDVARAVLQRHADDQHLEFHLRSETWENLVELDPTAKRRSAMYHQEVFQDEHENISNRTTAAHRLAELDSSHTRQAFGFLRRIAEDPRTPADERRISVDRLNILYRSAVDSVDPILSAVAHDPWTTAHGQHLLAARLPRKLRTGVERVLLNDHSIPIEKRLPRRDIWGDLPLATEAEAEVRDALTAVESLPAERVAAAAALAELSWQLVPEAIRLLWQLAQQRGAANQARRKLATLGRQSRRDVVTWAETQIRDETQPRRDRYRAASLIMDLTSEPAQFVTDFVRHVARDDRTSDRDRVDALFALRRIDGLDGLRALRDDNRRPPATRWRAAKMLLDRMVEDRAAGIHVLHSIAADTTVQPALRWRVARTLARLGVPGRDRAAAVLRAMTLDTTLPTTARAQAARALNDIMPSTRRHVLNVLRGMTAKNPLRRKQVLLAIGAVDAATAAEELRTIATDESLGAAARLRCAEALVDLRRDQRETAAAVARALAHDNLVPAHIRRHAARDLAHWSELCRAEARDLLRTISPTPAGVARPSGTMA